MKGAEEQDIFIRSMAHRSYPGGVAKAPAAAAYVMEGLGKDCIIMESIGAGQSDKDLFFLCDTVITIFTPDYGDDIQLFKAGLMEIGDIIVVNKSINRAPKMPCARSRIAVDRSQVEWLACPGAPPRPSTVRGSQGLQMRWKLIARPSQGQDKSASRKAGHLEAFLTALLKEELWQRISARITGTRCVQGIFESGPVRKMDPYSAVHIILESWSATWTSH